MLGAADRAQRSEGSVEPFLVVDLQGVNGLEKSDELSFVDFQQRKSGKRRSARDGRSFIRGRRRFDARSPRKRQKLSFTAA